MLVAPSLATRIAELVKSQPRTLDLRPMDITDVLATNRQRILDIARQYGASKVRVFGSVARGDAQPDSDIDLLVEMESNRSLLDLGGLVMELKQLLGCSVDVVTERGLKNRIRARALSEAVPL